MNNRSCQFHPWAYSVFRMFFLLIILLCAEGIPTISGCRVLAEETESSAGEESSAETELSSGEDSSNAGSALTALYEFRVDINGETLQIPISVAELTAQGWEYDGDADAQIAAGSYSPTEEFHKGDFHIYTLAWNTDINPAPVSECRIAGIFIDETQVEDADASVELPGNIRFGVSTLDDILAAYGDPTDREDDEDAIHLTYELENYRRADLYVDTESGVLNEIDLQNMVEETAQASGETFSIAETETESEPVSVEISDSPTETEDAAALAASWQVPDSLGENLLSWNVEYGGDLYQLPAPVSAFVANGWTINEADSDDVIAGQDFGWVYLQKDGQEFYAIALNYSDYAASLENCFVTSVEANTDSIAVSITLPGGITLGISEDELLNLLEGTDYTVEEDEEETEEAITETSGETSSVSTGTAGDQDTDAETETTEMETAETESSAEETGDRTYTIEDPDNSLNTITITIEKEASTVSGIEVSHVPDTL